MVDHALLADPRWRALRAERDLLAFRAAFALLLVPAAVSLPVLSPIGSALGHGRWDMADLLLGIAFAALSAVFGVLTARGGAELAAKCEGRPRLVLQARLLWTCPPEPLVTARNARVQPPRAVNSSLRATISGTSAVAMAWYSSASLR